MPAREASESELPQGLYERRQRCRDPALVVEEIIDPVCFEKPEAIGEIDEITEFSSGGESQSEKTYVVLFGWSRTPFDNVRRDRDGASSHLAHKPKLLSSRETLRFTVNHEH